MSNSKSQCVGTLLRRRFVRFGVALIELLVVIAIIGILAAVLIPAVQYCREAARQSTCRNHLRQIALAAHAHESAHGHLPSGGWGWRWHGEPERGFDARQPGGWVFNLLAYVEQRALRETGGGLSDPERSAVLSSSAGIAVSMFTCPSRRGPDAFPYVHPVGYVNMARPVAVARSDYAACSGDLAPDVNDGRGRGPSSLAEGDSPPFVWHELQRTGLVFRRSQIRLGQVKDGLSNTYLVGEKYVAMSEYDTGKAENDDQHLLVGYDSDTLRVTDLVYPPFCDSANFTVDHAFGSAHGSSFHMAMADGSVLPISYDIDLDVHRAQGNRGDGAIENSVR